MAEATKEDLDQEQKMKLEVEILGTPDEAK